MNDWKIEFHKNRAYYLVDPFDNAGHFCSFSKRNKMFSYIDRLDSEFNFSETKEQMGTLLFAFTGKPNCWI